LYLIVLKFFDFAYEHKEEQITTKEDIGKYLRKLLLKEKLSILEFGT